MRILKSSIVAICLLLPLVGHATMVRLQTVLGVVDIELFDSQVPLTVANFLSYVNSGAYNNSFVHRSVPQFVIQGGGYTFQDAGGVKTVTSGAPIKNEFSPSRSNARGTIAMAKGSSPDSATSQWFINLADNSASLDNPLNAGGFTVFGRVMGNGMAMVDAIAALKIVNAGTVFTELPLTSIPASGKVSQSELVMVTSVTVLSPADCLFDWAERTYPSLLAPPGAVSAPSAPYYYRYYSGTGNYLATSSADNHVWAYGSVSNNTLLDVGPLADFLTAAGCPQ